MKIEKTQNAEISAWNPFVQQKVFRQLMNAFAFPGVIETVLPSAQSSDKMVLRLILATLTDNEISVSDPHNLIDERDWLKFETKKDCPEKARFIVAPGDKAPGFSPSLGTLECPETGATIILRISHIGKGETFLLRGPGIKSSNQIAFSGLDKSWLSKRSEWNISFPLGVDMIFFDSQRLFAMPRTTQIKLKE